MKGSSIILATDLSETAKSAAKWAHYIARSHDLSIIVTHVVKISVSNWARGAYDVLEDPELLEKARQNVEDWYEDATGDTPDETEVLVGSSQVQLAETVKSHQAAMLVVSMSGKGAWKKFFLGSTVQALANDPPCPLVIVDPEHTEMPHDPPLIMAGTDFSRNGDRAISFAAMLARTTDADLHVVHADTAPVIEVVDASDLPEEYFRDGHYEWAEEELDKAMARHSDQFDGLQVEEVLIEEYPAKGIIDYAEDSDADMIVVGRSGQSQFVSSVLGSVVLKLVQTMPTTVIIVPSDYGGES